MRLGLYGGTFDPIHLGHLVLAEACREACALDRVWFVVAGSPPHKLGERTPVADRLEMVRIAVAGHPAFEVSEVEARGPGPHYSVQTLEAIGRDRPADELFFLIGADSLADLPTWRRPGRIAALATIVVANRPGVDPARLAAAPDFGRRVAIAWRDDGRAAKAVLPAMRCLARAERVFLLAGVREGRPRPAVPDVLVEHGVEAEAHVLRAGPGVFGQALLDKAHELGADMLVMGAYAHSPLRELVFGGVTRFMLGHADLPVLMRH